MHGVAIDLVHPIVMEASTPEDRAYMRSMSKNDIHQINGSLVQQLYTSTLERNQCDFGDIPASKGDITKVKYFKSTKECIEVLIKLLRMNNISEPGVYEIETAINNMILLTPDFTYGFKGNVEYLKLLYNTSVMAIIDSTSMLVATYMDYIVGPDQERYTPGGRFDKGRGMVSLESLRSFNTMVKNGTIKSAVEYAMKESKSNFAGTIVVAAGTIAALLAIVPLTRQLIFFYHSKRIALAEFMDLQAQFLEMHQLAVQNSKVHDAAKKKEILKKQTEVIKKMRRMRDKLMIKNDDATDETRKELKKDNDRFSLPNLEKSIVNDQMTGSASIQII